MKHGSIIPLSTNIKHTTINTFVEDLVYCFSEKMIPTKKVDVRPKRRKGKELIDTLDSLSVITLKKRAMRPHQGGCKDSFDAPNESCRRTRQYQSGEVVTCC